MIDFKSLPSKPIIEGIRYLFKADNGYGASIVQSNYSYGGEQGLWEVAVLKDGEICYDTPITNDVLGYLTEDEVNSVLSDIAAL